MNERSLRISQCCVDLTAVFGRGISDRDPDRLLRPLRDVLARDIRFCLEPELDPSGELMTVVCSTQLRLSNTPYLMSKLYVRME